MVRRRQLAHTVPAMPRATVIVPARNAARTLPRTLEGLARQHLEDEFEVIVVDDCSEDHTPEVAARSSIVTRVLRSQRGKGPGAARNAGVSEAPGDVLAFVDADCTPAPGWLAHGIRATEEFDLVQGKVLPDPDAELGPFDRTVSVGAAHGLFESANLFVRRELFDRLGGFPDGLAGHAQRDFGEDVMFGWQARRAGARTGFCEEAVVYHEVVERSPIGFISERARLALFPPLAARVPELRDAFFYRRFFHSPRSASFDLALAGLAIGLASNDFRPLALTAPYLRSLGSSVRRWGRRRAPVVALAEVAADCVGAAALLRGSVTARSPLL
jgi:glycosyltransferase involved in cell wall biosynthesis